MSPYIVQPGREVHDGMVYKAGDVFPAMKGSCPALVEDGAVAWAAAEKNPAVSAAAARLSEEKANNEAASEAGRVLESARKKKPVNQKPVK